jgi:hypothetical protein
MLVKGSFQKLKNQKIRIMDFNHTKILFDDDTFDKAHSFSDNLLTFAY